PTVQTDKAYHSWPAGPTAAQTTHQNRPLQEQSVDARLLAINVRTTRSLRQHALSFATIASKLAPTQGRQSSSRVVFGVQVLQPGSRHMSVDLRGRQVA